jgi:hypothetical protein
MANASLVPCSDAPCAQMDPHVTNASMTGPISSTDNVLATGQKKLIVRGTALIVPYQDVLFVMGHMIPNSVLNVVPKMPSLMKKANV